MLGLKKMTHAARVIALFVILSLGILWHNGVDAQENYDVRFVDGNSASEGRLEVFYSGEWGTVCSDSFTIVEAAVVCRQLGFHSVITYYDDAHFGQGGGPIWIDDLRCSSSRLNSIANCIHNVWGVHNCNHSKDVSVVCDMQILPSPVLALFPIYIYVILPLVVVVPVASLLCVGFLVFLRKRKIRQRQPLIAREIPLATSDTGLQDEGRLHPVLNPVFGHPDPSDIEPEERDMATTSFGMPDMTHESILESFCYIPFDINTITVKPQEEGVFDLVPPVQRAAEDSEDNIRVELPTGGNPFSLHHAVLVDGPFQLPQGYQLASHVVYLYSDPSQPVRPFTLHLPHWYSLEEEQREMMRKGEGDNLTFVMAPHSPSQVGEEVLYKFELQEAGMFPMLSSGKFLVDGHSTLFAIAYKEKITSRLRYCATHLECEEPSGQKVDIAVTFASSTWQKILQKHRTPSEIKGKPTEFNFQSFQIVGKVQRVVGKKWKASLEGSAQIDKEEVTYRSHGIRSAKALESAVMTGMYPPTLSFTVVYDTALKHNARGQPSVVKFFCDGATQGRLQFNSVVYEEKEGQGGEARGGEGLSDSAQVPSLMNLQDYIPPLADKWVELGIALGLEHQVLSLQTSSQPPNRCMLSLLSDWVHAGDKEVGGVRVEVSWAFLARVLRSPAVDKGSVASTIEAKYIRED